MTHEKCLSRLNLNLPESVYHDTLVEAAEQEVAAGALVRKVLEQYLYGVKGKRDAKRHDEARP